MAKIKAARLSPRFENGRLYFYEGNTFTVTLDLEFTRSSGEHFVYEEKSKIIFRSYDETEALVEEVVFEDVEDGSVTLEFDNVRSLKYPCGKYTYDVIYSGSCETTVAKSNQIIVE